MRVLFFGTFDAQTHPRVAVLRESFEAMGDDVRTLNHPIKFSTADRVKAVGTPWRLLKPAMLLGRSWWRLARDFRKLDSWQPEVVVVGYLAHFDIVLARLLFKGPIAFDMMVGLADTVESRGLGGGVFGSIAVRVGRCLDRFAQRLGSVTIYDTEAHRQLLSDCTDDDVVVPVGATKQWWVPRAPAAVSADRASEELRVVFFGTYSPLQGARVIGEAILLLADRVDISFTMIGDGQDRPAVEQLVGDHGRVTWIDWLSSEDLVAEVAAHDVCLGIFGTTARSGRVIPNKVYQGVAAGCVVISGDYPGQSLAMGDAVRLVTPGSGEALAAELLKVVELLKVADNREPVAPGGLEWASPVSLAAPLRQRLRHRLADHSS